MTQAAAHLLDSISNRINENRNLGNTASIQLGSLYLGVAEGPWPPGGREVSQLREGSETYRPEVKASNTPSPSPFLFPPGNV